MATSAQRRLAEREQDRIRDASGRRAAWAFLWVLFGFKIVTVGMIWYAATSTHSRELPFLVATTWYWFLIPIAAVAGPLLYRWRLIQMRRRRDELRGAEWMDHRRETPSGEPPLTIDDILSEYEHRGKPAR
jgi:hypothetical protein